MAEATTADDGWFGRLNRWASRSFFNAAESTFDTLGWTDAARGLRHYRSGGGKDLDYTDEEAARHPMIPAAEQLNRSRFESEVFTGRTREDEWNNKLLNLRDGDEPLRFTTRLARNYNFKPQGASFGEKLGKVWDDVSKFGVNPETYGTFGRFGVESKPDLSFQRIGNRLRVKGTVAHGFAGGNRFDFNEGQVGSVEAKTLEAAGEAKPYDLRFDRRQDVDAELDYEPNGRLTLRRAAWGATR